MAESRRDRVIVAAITHEAYRAHAGDARVASFERADRQFPECREIGLQLLTDRLAVASRCLELASATVRFQLGVQRGEVGRRWHGGEEACSRILHKGFDLALVVTLSRPAKPVLKQKVALQHRERSRSHARSTAEDLGHRDLGVVIQNADRYGAEEGKGRDVPVQERFRRLGRIALHKARIRVR